MQDDATTKVAEALIDGFGQLEIPERISAIEKAVIEAAPHVWGLKVAHTQVEAVVTLALCLMGLSFGVSLLALGERARRKATSWADDAHFAFFMVGGFTLIPPVIALSTSACIPRCLVPEWYAIQDLIALVK